jgi:hypothetical protein
MPHKIERPAGLTKLVLLVLALSVFGAAQAYAAVAGAQLWAKHYSSGSPAGDTPAAIGFDRDNNVLLAGKSASDYATIKYSPAGKRQWIKKYSHRLSSEEEVAGLAVDRSAGVVVTGTTRKPGGRGDILTVKYGAKGGLKWARTYDQLGKEDQAVAVAVDSNNNSYVAGYSAGDFVTIKYDPLGKQQWVKRFNSPFNKVDRPTALTVDSDNNVYVVGSSRGANTDFDVITIKYGSGGGTKWTRRHAEAGGRDDEPVAVAVDRNGNVFVAATTRGSDYRGDYLAIKYDAAGNKKWTRRHAGSGFMGARAADGAVDRNGNFYVTGTVEGGSYNNDLQTLKYSPKGELRWSRRYDSSGYDIASKLAVDRSGNILATGMSFTESTGYTLVTMKYDTLGQRVWLKKYKGGADYGDAVDLASDRADNALVLGLYGSFSAQGTGFATVKYAP